MIRRISTLAIVIGLGGCGSGIDWSDCEELVGAPQIELVDCVVDRIDDIEKKRVLLSNIARAQIRRMAAIEDAKYTVGLLGDLLDEHQAEFDEETRMMSYRHYGAYLAEVGDQDRARKFLRQAFAIADQSEDDFDRELGIEFTLEDMVKTGNAVMAVRLADQLAGEKFRNEMLTEILKLQAQYGDARGAVDTVGKIAHPDTRALADALTDAYEIIVKETANRGEFGVAVKASNRIASQTGWQHEWPGAFIVRAWTRRGNGPETMPRVETPKRCTRCKRDYLKAAAYGLADAGLFSDAAEFAQDREMLSNQPDRDRGQLYLEIAERQIEVWDFKAANATLTKAHEHYRAHVAAKGDDDFWSIRMRDKLVELKVKARDPDGALAVLGHDDNSDVKQKTWKEFADWQVRTSDLDGAKKTLQFIDDENTRGYRQATIVEAYTFMGDEKAARDMIETIDLDKDMLSAHQDMVVMYAKLGAHEAAMEELEQIDRYETEDRDAMRAFATFWAVAAAPESIAKIKFHACDDEASSMVDQDSLSAGVLYADIDAAAAVDACARAVKDYPLVRQYQYQYGRALYKANRFDDAYTWLQRATDFEKIGLYRSGRYGANAQQALGLMYLNGQSVNKNDFMAARMYLNSAIMGNAQSQRDLAWLYAMGRGTPEDGEQALVWVNRSIAQNYAAAKSFMGFLYMEGKGVEQSDTEAVKWNRIAADEGDVDGQANLGYMYEMGRGVDKDLAEAKKWYQLAAEQGNEYSKSRIAALSQ